MSPNSHDWCRERIITASHKLDSWIETEKFKGWDPFDALNSPVLRRLTISNRRVGQFWVQVLKHSPINLRPLLRITKAHNPKAMGLFLASSLRKYTLFGNSEYLDHALFFADWLKDHISPGYSGACWGYNFDWPNRGFFAPAETPTIVNTSFIALAFLDLFNISDQNHSSFEELNALTLAESACNFIISDLNTIRPAYRELCFSYTPHDQRYVHNANVLGAWLLAAVHSYTGQSDFAEYSLAAARYTCHRQQDNGAWFYGESHYDHWVDNFHTGFVLVGLKKIAEYLATKEFDDIIYHGYTFWKSKFFLPNGWPKYTPDRIFPSDIHSVSQAILTFLEFSDLDEDALCLAERTALWGIEHMQDTNGSFHYQVHRHYRIKIPYMRWSQAWMQRAFVEMLSKFPT